ncbi:MAG TPA: cytochrome C [Myxococcales bacterium]|nr:cytochrome C [Myxococcales bacterium]
MKARISSILVAGGIAALGFAPNAFAFHDGGVAYCEGCHTMHNSQNGATIRTGGTVGQGVKYLLKGSDQSSTCLTCHANAATGSYHIMTWPVPNWAGGLAPINFTPGGDFAWITSPNRTSPTGSHSTPAKSQHLGHNVIAADYVSGAFGVADPDIATAPGGTYAAANLMCISCHNPHPNGRVVDSSGTIAYNTLGGTPVAPITGSGSYGAIATATEAVGVYRLLGGVNYAPLSYVGAPKFTADPPVAVAPSTYNRTEAATQTRVAYGKGMSEWCANCHTNIHTSVSDGQSAPYIHPAGATALLSQTANLSGTATTNAAIYTAYKSSGDLSGNQTSSYLSLVPFEEGTGNIATLASHAVIDNSQLGGPITGNENVMCLSCHRAHASGFGSMTRWAATGDEFITIAGAWPGKDRTDADSAEGIAYSDNWTQAQYTAAMYNYPATTFGGATGQNRSLCNKCHAKD